MFRLLRYFTIACSITSLILAITLVVILNTFQVRSIIHGAEDQNVLMSRLLANTIEAAVPNYLDTPDLIDPQSLRNRLIVQELNTLFRSLTVGLNLLKIKIYNTEGLTLYSSDSSQIGESRANNPRFLRAANKKEAASKLSARDKFTAFTGVLYNVDVVETYIPILSDEKHIIGVFELYTDVTHLRTLIKEEMIWISMIVISIFILFFFILLLIILRADSVIKNQYQKLEKSHQTIEKRTETLYKQANYDDLTKLANRVYMYGQLKHELILAAKNKTTLAFLFIDLDGFKNINDRHGHDVGDEVLITIARRFMECVKEHDSQYRSIDSYSSSTVARHGGDEFSLIIPDFFKLQDVDVIAKDIISACSKPLKIKNKELILGASIGIALYPSDGDEPSTLMRNADLAMYQAKQEGKNTFRYFTDDLIKDSERRTVMEVE